MSSISYLYIIYYAICIVNKNVTENVFCPLVQRKALWNKTPLLNGSTTLTNIRIKLINKIAMIIFSRYHKILSNVNECAHKHTHSIHMFYGHSAVLPLVCIILPKQYTLNAYRHIKELFGCIIKRYYFIWVLCKKIWWFGSYHIIQFALYVHI